LHIDIFHVIVDKSILSEQFLPSLKEGDSLLWILKLISGKKFCHLLESQGWELKRITGSHHIYAKTGNTARISVPVHGNNSLKIGLQRHLMKVADIEESDLTE
jgi:predicted RNA binding protein YcfA (HicA-like mRNA interferase family)